MPMGPSHSQFSPHNPNSMGIIIYCNSIARRQIAIKFGTCHESTAVVTCAKSVGDIKIRFYMRYASSFFRNFNQEGETWVRLAQVLVPSGNGINIINTSSRIAHETKLSPYTKKHSFNACYNISSIYLPLMFLKGVDIFYISREKHIIKRTMIHMLVNCELN